MNRSLRFFSDLYDLSRQLLIELSSPGTESRMNVRMHRERQCSTTKRLSLQVNVKVINSFIPVKGNMHCMRRRVKRLRDTDTLKRSSAFRSSRAQTAFDLEISVADSSSGGEEK